MFIYVLVQVQLQTIYTELLKRHGCFLEVQFHRSQDNSPNAYLNRTFYDGLLDSDRYRPYVKDFAYQSEDLYQLLYKQEDLDHVQASDVARQFFLNQGVTAVTPNFLQILIHQNYEVSQTLSICGLDPAQFLYTADGRNSAIISLYSAEKLNIKVHQPKHEFLLTLSWP